MPEGLILFTAFEPSGDAHAAPVIAEILRRRTGLRIYACGGPKMEAAGASILERTVDLGAMGLHALRRIGAFRDHLGRMKNWVRGNRVVAHVAVDSPAANFPLARVLRRAGARVLHLVAPQLWAWAPWRLGGLRRLTSGVMCLLPFEERWFTERGVPARFIGHPSINRSLDQASIAAQVAALPAGAPRVAIFPGSRLHEVRHNAPLLADVYRGLRARHEGLAGIVAAAGPALEGPIRQSLGDLAGLHLASGAADAAIAWCDLALAVSGTVTLDIARQRRPMVGVYRTGRFSQVLARILVRTPYRLLPNIVAGRAIVPEFVPHVSGVGPVTAAAARLLEDRSAAEAQRRALDEVCRSFDGHDPAREAADLILASLGAAPGKGMEPRRTRRTRR